MKAETTLRAHLPTGLLFRVLVGQASVEVKSAVNPAVRGDQGLHRPVAAGDAVFLVPLSVLTQLCPALRGHMDCSPPGSSAPGIFQARILE